MEDVVDLLREPARQHLVGLIKDEDLHVVGLEHTALDHVVDTAGRANDDLRAILESLHILAHAGAANAGMALDAHEVADSDNHLLNLLCEFAGRGEDQRLAGLEIRIDLLEDGDGEGGGLASAGLSLRNHIIACEAVSR